MNTEPKVSIIIPCFSREKFISETLACVTKIDYPNWECIVVDDSSTDNLAKIIKSFEAKNPSIHYVRQAKANISVTRNNAVAHSSGKYILPLDSDDLIDTRYVKEAVEILEKNPNVKVVTCDAEYFGRKKGQWKLPPFVFKDFLIANSLHNSSMYRRTDFDQVHGYDPGIDICEDWDFWISLLKTGGTVHKIEKNYFFYRKHEQSTMKTLMHTTDAAYKIIYQKHKELYTELLDNPILLLRQHQKYKKGYNQLRRITFRKPIP